MLTICLSELRRVLGETRQAPQFIETVARRGYRFIGAVRQGEPVAAAAGPAGSPPPPPTAPGLLVGREAALRQVQGWWGRVQQGARQVGFVTGEAGIGKTTLVDAWCARWPRPARSGRGGGSVWTIMGRGRRTCRCWRHWGNCVAGRRGRGWWRSWRSMSHLAVADAHLPEPG